MSDELTDDQRAKPTLAEFGTAPGWFAEWCLKREDLQGFSLDASRHEGGSTTFLMVKLYWRDRKVSQMFTPNDATLQDPRYVQKLLDRLAEEEPKGPIEDP